MLLPKGTPGYWTVFPTPGYLCKWKEVKCIGPMGGTQTRKCFINVCHCNELPPPMDDLDEEQLAAKLDAGDTSYKIPMCVGDMDLVDDKKGVDAIKIDVLVNTSFYNKRLSSPFFRHFVCMIFSELIESKHDIHLDPAKCVIMKNRVLIGPMESFKVAKKPVQSVVEEKASFMYNVDDAETSDADSDKDKGIQVKLFEGKRLEIWLDIEEAITDYSRLKLKTNPTRIMVLADNTRSLYDMSLPFRIEPSTAKSKFIGEKNRLVYSADVAFKR